MHPVDMRRQIDGLCALVRDALGLDPLSGHLAVFFNKRGDHARVIFWDRNGFCMVSKRLERGVFKTPWDHPDGSAHHQVEAAELALILEGIDLRGARRRPRWMPPPDSIDRAADSA